MRSSSAREMARRGAQHLSDRDVGPRTTLFHTVGSRIAGMRIADSTSIPVEVSQETIQSPEGDFFFIIGFSLVGGTDILMTPTFSGFRDTFTGSAGTLLTAHFLDTGQSWVEPAASFAGVGHVALTASNQAGADGTYQFNPYLVDVLLATNLQTVQADFLYHDTSSDLTLIARSNNSASTGTYDDVEAGWFGGHWFINTYQWGDLDTLVESLSADTVYTLELVVDDTTASLYVDGVLKLTVDYATHFTGADGGYVGFSVGGSGTAEYADNFEATYG